MNENHNAQYGATILRVILGLLFIVPGISKLMNPGMIAGMLGDLGFPAAAFFGWIVLLSEISFGAAVLLGYKVRYTVWPLVTILGVAILSVHLPKIFASPMGIINVTFHILGIGTLVSLYLTGAGALALDKE
jgi:putative oxidoreductase